VKISHVAVEVVRVPVDHPYTAGGRAVDANWHVLARITTSDGIEGIGRIQPIVANVTPRVMRAAPKFTPRKRSSGPIGSGRKPPVTERGRSPR